MGQKSTDQKLSRDDIVAAVARLIAGQGLETLTMRNIAREVGCSVGTLPYYFTGKEDIVIAALNWSSERIMNRVSNLPPEEIRLDNLYALLRASMPLDTLSDTEWRVRLCLWDYAATNDGMRQSVNRIADTATEMLINLVQYLQRVGDINPSMDPELIAISVYQMCIGVGFNMLHIPVNERETQLRPLHHFIESIRAASPVSDAV